MRLTRLVHKVIPRTWGRQAECGRTLLSQLATYARHSPQHPFENNAMVYLMLKTGFRTIEVSRARIEHLQELVPGEKWRLWVHGKGGVRR